MYICILIEKLRALLCSGDDAASLATFNCTPVQIDFHSKPQFDFCAKSVA